MWIASVPLADVSQRSSSRRAVEAVGRRQAVWVGLIGPTGSGKSQLAVELAGSFSGEVVNCDALQVYRGLDIGTAKIRDSETRGIPHHLFDVIAPNAEFSAAEFAARSADVIRSITLRDRLAFLVGGTGLYLRSLRHGLFAGPGRMPRVRRELRRIAETRGPGYLHHFLSRLDPTAAGGIHRNDELRLIRALEVCLVTGRRFSDLKRERSSPLPEFRSILLGLAPGRDELKRRIVCRVEAMFAGSLVQEVRQLMGMYGNECPAFKAIGYREVAAAIRGDCTVEQAQALTLSATVQYAKRQMTWFRRESDVAWFEGCGDERRTAQAVRQHLTSEMEALEKAPSAEAGKETI